MMLCYSRQQDTLWWFTTCHSSFSLHPWAIIMVWWFVLPQWLLSRIDGFSHSKDGLLVPSASRLPPWSRSNWRADALVPGDYSDIKEDQRRRSSWNLWFLFLFFFCNGKRKVLIFQMLVVQIKIISICGLDWCLRIVFWHLIHMGSFWFTAPRRGGTSNIVVGVSSPIQ